MAPAQVPGEQHRLSSAVMALITTDCINGPNHLGLQVHTSNGLNKSQEKILLEAGRLARLLGGAR